jgi:uncharacterized membrane protein
MSDMMSHAYDRAFGGEGNLSMTERAISVALGLGIAAAAARRPSAIGMVALLAGGALALRGATGHCPVKAALTDGGGSQKQIAYQH